MGAKNILKILFYLSHDFSTPKLINPNQGIVYGSLMSVFANDLGFTISRKESFFGGFAIRH